MERDVNRSNFNSNAEHDETQFAAIRDLMLEASLRGVWLTLAEISESTEFGEASISAQLRHLRKPRFGHYRVEKRRREMYANAVLRLAENKLALRLDVVKPLGAWEYRVFTAQQPQGRAIFEALHAICSPDGDATPVHEDACAENERARANETFARENDVESPGAAHDALISRADSNFDCDGGAPCTGTAATAGVQEVCDR